MIESQPPELHDGGYWYVRPVVPDPERGGQTPGEVPGVGWCAWYYGDRVLVRTPEPVSLVSIELPAGLEKLPGRVGGS